MPNLNLVHLKYYRDATPTTPQRRMQNLSKDKNHLLTTSNITCLLSKSYLNINKMHSNVSFPVIPESQIDALSKHLYGRLGAICFGLWHADVIDEYHAEAADWWTEYTCKKRGMQPTTRLTRSTNITKQVCIKFAAFDEMLVWRFEDSR